ncbi:MAG: phosphate ABC transporter permease PstA [Proteobacteria bacterium]|nr:phosphate ABC transporter permease PstA [Pseudomonadota bacterium]
MTDTTFDISQVKPDLSAKRIAKRYASERRFKLYGQVAILIALAMLALLMGTIIAKGYTAFTQTHIAVDVNLSKESIDPNGTGDPAVIGAANYRGISRSAIRQFFPEVSGRRDLRALYQVFSNGISFEIRDLVLKNPELIGTTQRIELRSSADIDMLTKGFIDRSQKQENRRVTDKQLAWYDKLVADGRVSRPFNTTFFSNADSREPEQAGVLGAVIGSGLTLLVTLVLVFPIGVMSAIYLEELAPKNRWTDIIEVNINNLAAVPSIVFGLLGLAVLLNFLELPRSVPLVGGIVLALMTLPTIIIAGRSAILAVPPSIREAALGVGASRMQVIFHHVLPLAMPGMMTGTIIGMARALGETAPLLMIGMVAFVATLPQGINDASTVLPVQIFLWADAPERAFVERTSAATMVLLAFLILMNLTAIMLRKKFERRW